MGTAVVGLVLLAVVAVIIRGLVKGKRAGKTSCGGDCAHCGKGACGAALTASAPSGPKANAAGKKAHVTLLDIDGMMCSMCESHVNDAIRNHFSVTSVKSSHKTGRTEIVSEAPLDEALLRQSIEETGYIIKNITVG